MFCTQCGQSLGEADAFCTSCGRQRFGGQVPAQLRASQTLAAVEGAATASIPRIAYLILGIAQIVGVVFWVIFYIWAFDFEFESVYRLHLIVLINALILSVPMFAVGLNTRLAQDGRFLGAVAGVGLVRFFGSAYDLVNDDIYGGIEQWILRLSYLLSCSAIVGLILVIVQLKPNRRLLDFKQDFWRAPLGVAAVLFLILEKPGRVIPEGWPLLSFLLFPVIVVVAFLPPFLRQGFFAGLGISVVAATISGAMWWVINWSYHNGQSFVSLPSLIAIACCVVAMIPFVPGKATTVESTAR